MIDLLGQIIEILDVSKVKLSNILPSDWAEQNIIMPPPFPGPLRYEKTPYTREIIDCFAEDHPAREIAVMGAAQFGKTGSILVPLIGYLIANAPGNIIMTVGHEDLIAEAMDKIDYMLDTTKLRKLIRPSAMRAKSQKTGDTNTVKQFPNGYIKLSSASNPKIWRQADYKYALIDDYEGVKGNTKTAGNTRGLILKRLTAYAKTRKVLYLSSPEIEQGSNILEVYRYGDQRKFLIPCPCCGVFIELKWAVNGKNGETCGITWKVDEEEGLVDGSVGYICQECGDFFTDQYKTSFINKGYWKPTAKPFRPEFFSYHMSSLYSPHGMSDWKDYVYLWLEAHPTGLPRIERKYQSFINLNLGEPYAESAESPKASELQKNVRGYEIGTVPEKLSIADGNGNIVLLTCACDLNGTLEDARLDYEVVGWSENNTQYSITQGSVGTFILKENQKKNKIDRKHWTYEFDKENSVWPEFTKIIDAVYETDTGRRMKVFISGVDTGHYAIQAVYPFIDASNNFVVGLKGDKEDKFIPFGVDVPTTKPAKERNNLYILQVNKLKDQLAECMKLKYSEGKNEQQTTGFINFPQPSGDKYSYANYFEHFESEEKKPMMDKDGNSIATRWQKKTANSQNHFWDVKIYNMALRDIVVYLICKDLKIKNYGWKDYVDVLFNRR